MLQMKFKPRFIEAFTSGQKLTTLRLLDFKCRCYEETNDRSAVYFHEGKLKYNMHVSGADGINVSLPSGTTVKYSTDLAGLLERQPYRPGDEIELITEIEGGEKMPFATATIADVSVIRGKEVDSIDAINDGFNPDRDPLAELHAFMRDVYHITDPDKAMYWRYVFTSVQMFPQWGGEA
ncbi:hypothetical protein N7Y48_000255 [Salmonella enterica]|nr:hypothetical protein [Salmonella enterica]